MQEEKSFIMNDNSTTVCDGIAYKSNHNSDYFLMQP